MIRNRFLPQWLQRVCNGVVGAMLLLAIGSVWIGEPTGSWKYLLSLSLFLASVPLGILLALLTRRFSLVEGIAGDVGSDELSDSVES